MTLPIEYGSTILITMSDTVRVARRAEFQFLFIPLVLALIGLVLVHSASVNVAIEETGSALYYLTKQLQAFVLGSVLLLVLQSIPYTFWQRRAAALLWFTILILVAVLIFPNSNIKSWIDLGPLSFQPAELAKMTFILFFAAWLEKRRGTTASPTTFLSFLILIGIITVLLMLQPDFGTLSILIFIAFSMYWVAGMNWRHLLTFLLIGTLVGGFFIWQKPYRWQRITSFMNPAADLEGSGYHSQNLYISVGSGSWWGLGLGNSKQKRLFLPEPHTDSIFAVTTEELGFGRAAPLLLLLFGYVASLLSLARRSEHAYIRYALSGFAAWLFVQTVMNVGAVIGLVPLTGVPLPFISYGGTSLLVLLAASGVILNMSKYSHRA
jgi:cell division protein FtsW